jgi:hypothetical protein
MVVNKVAVIPFKKSAVGNIVYICKPYFTEDEVFFLPNTASSGDESILRVEAENLLHEFGFKSSLQKQTTIDLGILIYKKIAFKGYAILVEDELDTKKIPVYIEKSAFVKTGEAVEKSTSPFKEFLLRFKNWTVL